MLAGMAGGATPMSPLSATSPSEPGLPTSPVCYVSSSPSLSTRIFTLRPGLTVVAQARSPPS
ncbi:MAG: hypothetical protein DI618_00145 [Dermacoccus nishinomiyaensis]|uniref:Uncharacterized protein n=1 Tax=Dermacoccus nishinomiyaensis TaxID=1274 RepID=A0A075JH05_9MICO|nr:hypothetical protein HX89_09690 [Dermacoccus nishinomiyaensis]EFP58392.1 hypothetical protein HMPREF0321_0012 [Dermacoccus sp. Ellin185]PZP05658.1 MAG: hypothetical protein DI618_00145 [Dermacoccus nishinomiyaensis]HCQ17670.1 hypothetical protein [Dermacoccus sp.]